VSHRGSGLDVIDRHEGGFSFIVTGAVASGGVIELPIETDITRHGHVTLPRATA
jgi:hypothetical protein